MPNSSVNDQLLSLPLSQKSALCQLWEELFKIDPPLQMGKGLIIQFLAYRIQEQEFGGVSDRSHRRLRELAKSIEATSSTKRSLKPVLKPGTRLIRQWKDQIHIVDVAEGSYEYRDARYESLSEIARLITGTRWSGPAFFGLKVKATQKSKEVM